MADIEIRRSGRSSKEAHIIRDADPKITRGNGMAMFDYKPEGITLEFLVNGGKGKSEMLAWLKPSSFLDLAEKMLAASPKEAERAFLTALLKRNRKAKANAAL